MEFLDQIEQTTKNTETHIINLSDAVISSRKHMTVKTGDKSEILDLSLSEDGFRQFVNAINVPYSYAKKMPVDLADHTFNYLLSSRNHDQLRVVHQNGVVKGFMNTEYPYIDPLLVVDSLVSNLSSTYKFSQSSVSESMISAKIMLDDHVYEINGGKYLGGVSFSYSDIWLKFPVLESYLNRLICANGATAPVSGKKFRISGVDTKSFLTQIARFSGDAEGQIHKMMEGFIALQGVKIENVRAMIKQICKNYGIPNKIASEIILAADSPNFLATIENNKIVSMYDVINIFTWVGTHSKDISEEYRQILCEIGGKQMINNHDRCNSCGSTV
jgi:hypothetical protein